jgi:FixJ family two-component response regulator
MMPDDRPDGGDRRKPPRHGIPQFNGQRGIRDCALAMKRGAVNFLMKPAREDLRAAIDEAFRIREATAWEDSEIAEFRGRFALLTSREKEVCIKVTGGLLNKQIAGDLEIAEKTIKVHRAPRYGEDAGALGGPTGSNGRPCARATGR